MLVLLDDYSDIIVQKLLEALQAPNLDRAVKPEILAALGDIAMAIGEAYIKYVRRRHTSPSIPSTT